MEIRCHYCEETDNLDTCRRCLRPICPQHRWGTGSVSDGYYCLSLTNECDGVDESPMAAIMGVSMAPRPTIYQRINRIPMKWWLLSALILGVAISFSAKALLVAAAICVALLAVMYIDQLRTIRRS